MKIFKTTKWYDAKFDDIIDVRSPSEYHEDHIIGSMNCPVLNDSERKLIGEIYKKDSPFKAKVIGSSIISMNISKIFKKHFSKKSGSWRPLVYCWRGGQRSKAMSVVMSEVGWRTTQLIGGYKSYRQDITDKIEKISGKLKITLISGKTGTGKTKLLHRINNLGGQVIDLEKIANHKGSLLGKNINSPQPLQKLFESQLHHCLNNLNVRKKVFIEAESSKIGDIHIPKPLWLKMLEAERINIEADLETRVNFLLDDYKYVQLHNDFFYPLLEGLRYKINKKTITEWKNYIQNREWYFLTKSLLSNHYDPSYETNYKRKNHHVLRNFFIKNVSKKELTLIAKKILTI